MGVWIAPEGTFTIEEFKRLPLEGRRWELLDGKVVRMEDHGAQTSYFTGSLLVRILDHVKEHRLGWVLGPGCGFRCWFGKETVRVTDASFTRHDRLPDKSEWDDYPRNAPDLIVEVFSPWERTVTVVNRIAMFMQAGTRLAWLVYQENQTIEIFDLENSPMMLRAGDVLDGGVVLPGFRAPVAQMFAED